jgi:fumarate reductase (CoM/CoB) subunit B
MAEPYFQRLELEIDPDEPITVLELLLKVRQEQLPDLAFSYACRAGQCGSCAIKINGVNRLACKTVVEGPSLTLKPREGTAVLRDLVVDTEAEYERFLKAGVGFRTDLEPPHRIAPADYSRLAKLRECVECFACVSACPLQAATERFVGPLGLRALARLALDGRTRGPEEYLAQAAQQGSYLCTSCRRCLVSCDKDIDLPLESLLPLRRAIFRAGNLEGLVPENVRTATQTIASQRNIFAYDNIERVDIWGWQVEDEVPIQDLVGREAKVAYFVGCLTSFKTSLDFIAQNTVRVLHRLGENFTLLGPDEFCCGFPTYLAGGEEDFLEENIQRLQRLGIEKLLLTCPGCYRSFGINYPQQLGRELPFQVQHLTEYLAERLETGLSFPRPLEMEVAWHDPCDLGRYGGVYEEPRRLLRAMGVEVKELVNSGPHAQCCGRGGLLPMVDEEASLSLARRRLQEIQEAGVTALVTACPGCWEQFDQVTDGIQVHDISQLVLKAL